MAARRLTDHGAEAVLGRAFERAGHQATASGMDAHARVEAGPSGHGRGHQRSHGRGDPELAERWDTAAADADDAVEPGSSAATTIAGVAIRIRVDPSRRRVIVEGPPDVSRLLAFVHLGGGLPPTLGSLPQAHFEATVDGRYLIAVEPASVARGAHPAADATADRPAPETR